MMLGTARGHAERVGDIVDCRLRESRAGKNLLVRHVMRLGFAWPSVDPDVLLIDEVLAVGDEHYHKCLDKFAEFADAGARLR